MLVYRYMSNNTHYKLMTGSAPVIVTAPHAFAHTRPNLVGSIRQAEDFTDAIAMKLASDNQVYSLVTTRELDYDPNFVNEGKNPFKTELGNLASSEKLKYLIDVHGLSENRSYDIALYYPRRFSKSQKLARKMANALLDDPYLKYLNIQILNFPTSESETLSEFATRELKMGAVQVEVARYLREDEGLRQSLHDNLNQFIPTL